MPRCSVSRIVWSAPASLPTVAWPVASQKSLPVTCSSPRCAHRSQSPRRRAACLSSRRLSRCGFQRRNARSAACPRAAQPASFQNRRRENPRPPSSSPSVPRASSHPRRWAAAQNSARDSAGAQGAGKGRFSWGQCEADRAALATRHERARMKMQRSPNYPLALRFMNRI